MKLLVCGGRDYNDEAMMFSTLDYLHSEQRVVVLIHGGARGADMIAGMWARSRGVQEVICPANWDLHGKSAGFRRNSAMLELEPDLIIAFPGGRGTASMIDLARKAKMAVKVYEQKDS